MESRLEAVKLLPAANGEMWKGAKVGQNGGDGYQQGTNVGQGDDYVGQYDSKKDYGSIEVLQNQPTAGAIPVKKGEKEMQTHEAAPAMMKLIQSCMCIPDAAAAKSGNYDKCSCKL